MNKKTKSADELHALIIDELRKKNEFDSVTPSKPYWHERDTSGRNWDLSSWRGYLIDVVEAKNFLEVFVNNLRDRYDISE